MSIINRCRFWGMVSVATQKKSKSLDGPIKKTKKKQGRISLKMPVISDFFTENVTFFPNIPSFPQKVIFYPPKFLMAFFSHQLKISNFRQQHDTFQLNQLTIPYFAKNHKKQISFPYNVKNPRKTQALLKHPRKNPRSSLKNQEPKIGSKIPRSWEKTQGVETLGMVIPFFYNSH